jgi:hypothetical protein
VVENMLRIAISSVVLVYGSGATLHYMICECMDTFTRIDVVMYYMDLHSDVL